MSFLSLALKPGFLLGPFGFALIGFPNAALSGAQLVRQPENFSILSNPLLRGITFDVHGIGRQIGPTVLGGFTSVGCNQIHFD